MKPKNKPKKEDILAVLSNVKSIEDVKKLASTEGGRKAFVFILIGFVIGIFLKIILIALAVMGMGYLIYTKMQKDKVEASGLNEKKSV